MTTARIRQLLERFAAKIDGPLIANLREYWASKPLGPIRDAPEEA